MKLSLKVRIARLERQADVLRGQLPHVGPGRSQRLQLVDLLALVTDVLEELRRRRALKRERDLLERRRTARVASRTDDGQRQERAA